MTAEIIDGKKIAEAVREEVAAETAELKARGVTPGLTVVRVGEDPASAVYVRGKKKAAEKAGFSFEEVHLTADTTQDELLEVVDRLNADPDVHGFIVQLPLPDQIDEDAILYAIDPAKDVDGFHPFNQGLLLQGMPRFVPATPMGVRELLVRSGVDTRGKNVVIVGRSNIVGRPLAALLLGKGEGGDATVTVAHSRTKLLDTLTRQADILVAAIGKPEFIRADMIRPGAVVIDVGINRLDDGRLVGDVAFEDARDVAGAITPVPGGVGPMTIACLLKNTLEAARRSAGTE